MEVKKVCELTLGLIAVQIAIATDRPLIEVVTRMKATLEHEK